MRFVFSACPKKYEPLIHSHDRLYAHPREPHFPQHDDDLVIIDSGAFGLWRAGVVISADYMLRLKERYARYPDSIIKIAPDERYSPYKSRKNFEAWLEMDGCNIAPVVQFRKSGQLDLTLLMDQVRFYAQYESRIARFNDRPFVCISNCSFTAEKSQSLIRFMAIVRTMIPNAWFHGFARGWSPDDVRRWRQSGAFDSIDSTLYYVQALDENTLWLQSGETTMSNLPPLETLASNIHVAATIK